MTYKTTLDTWYNKLTTWYVSKPWYLRILYIGLVAVIVFLFLFRFIARGIPKEEEDDDAVTVVPPANPTAHNDDEEVTNAKKTLELKKQLVTQLQDSTTHQLTYRERIAEIEKAQTMEELNELRKKFNL